MKTKSKIFKTFVYTAAALTFAILIFIIADLFIKGIPYIKPEMFALKYSSSNLSMMPAIINTMIMVVLAILMAGPVGIITAIYLNEYASSTNILIKPVKLTSQTLAGIPSIVYGLFGSLFFVTFLGWKYSLLAGACTLAIMILPIFITSTEEALLSVSKDLREASFGLGAMNLRTIFRIVLPYAMPGILAGIVLSVGRIVGETAALIFTAGSSPRIPRNLFSSGRTLSTHMYILSGEGMHKNEAYATGVILILVVLVMNFISSRMAASIGKGGIDE
ncbi:phosphate ABC transporter permease PstA [Microaceticoccus formicicus]|uniref:phosphate ABC transporter permease PstA n=1 Tax=Microaceticoccus formicicus TaxID=3118105 RepID=UPI003CD0296E|nr:phosphate ABC transporter permease PstA [Peptoniphilaceae bacterium AMB_02]